MKHLISIIFFLLFVTTAVQSQEINMTDLLIFPSNVYEGYPIYLAVNVTSSNKISSVNAIYSNYSVNLIKRFTRNATLNLIFGNQTSGIWLYTFMVPEGIYMVDSITATDVNKNYSTIYLADKGFRVYRNASVVPNITNECNASISLGRTQFNSSERVNYSIRMNNNGITLMNPNASVVGPVQTSSKPIEKFFVDSGESVDISFNFTAPNISEDSSYTFILYVDTDECTFSFPFQFLIKKFQPNGTVIPNATNTTNQTNGGTWEIPIFNWKLPFEIPEISIPGSGQKISGIGLVILIVVLIILCVFVLFMMKEVIKILPKKKPAEETEGSEQKREF